MVNKLYEEKKKALGHSIISYVDLNGLVLDCLSMCKCKFFTLRKPFKPFVLYTAPNCKHLTVPEIFLRLVRSEGLHSLKEMHLQRAKNLQMSLQNEVTHLP